MGPPTAAVGGEVEQSRRRCVELRHRIDTSLPATKISPACRLTLLRLLDAELRFLSRLPPDHHHPVSPNIGYLESVVRVIQQPAVRQVSRVCKPVPGAVHVDVVCTLGCSPAWILVSDRNPAHIAWAGPPSGPHRGVGARVERVLAAARSAALALRPDTVVLVFSGGLGRDVACNLVDEFGAVEIDLVHDWDLFEELEEGWVGVGPVLERARVFEIEICSDRADRVPVSGILEDQDELHLKGDAFGSLISSMKLGDSEPVDMINFDTTALVALVSGISNGDAKRLLKVPEIEMRQQFGSNYVFVMTQVKSELQHPILAELEAVIAGKKGIVCESVCSEFKELVNMYGGTNEKWRAYQLLKHLLVVPVTPSLRVMNLPTTRKIASKNKIIFGTGDYWHAPTLTANMGFVRAISQIGMSLLTIEHRPCALIGD